MDLHTPMPGSFLGESDNTVCPALTRAEASAALFIPPQSPSASIALSQSIRSSSQSKSVAKVVSRKRQRIDVSASIFGTPQAPADTDASSYSLDAPSPAPFVNTRYRIKGGLDTPSAAQAQKYEDEDDYGFEQYYRPNRFASRNHLQHDMNPATPANNHVPKRGRSRSPSYQSGWGTTAWQLTGGLAGKVLNFCWTTAFRGFHAGGGQGYDMHSDTSGMVESSKFTDINEKEDVFRSGYRKRGVSPLPGQFPEEDLIEDYMSKPEYYQSHDTTPTQLTDSGGGSILRSNWVVVDQASPASSFTSSGRRKLRSSASLQSRQPSIASFAGSRTSSARPSISDTNTSASYASSRGAAQPAIPAASRPPPSESPVHRAKRSRPSFASPRQSELNAPSTPKSPEVVRFEKQIRKKERKQDDSIRRLNQQLKDMIREGKEALKSQIDVEDASDMEDEGYSEGFDDRNYRRR